MDYRLVPVSSSFYPGSYSTPHDAIFRSIDGIHFYVQKEALQKQSPTAFQYSIANATSPDDGIDIPEQSAVLDIILHTLYYSSCSANAPTLDLLEMAVDHMSRYGIIPVSLILPKTPLFDLLLSHGMVQPFRVYSLAARHGLYALAVQCSSSLLAVDPFSVTDEMAINMDAVYLKKFFLLHIKVQDSLKDIVRAPPTFHTAHTGCNFEGQRKLGMAWNLAAAVLIWDGKSDISPTTIRMTFGSLEDQLECERCKKMLQARVREVDIKWAAVKRTI